MANEEHWNILLKGVEAWNQWRKFFPHITPDLSGKDFIAVEGLSGINFSKANLDFNHFNSSTLIEADFSEASLRSTFFNSSNLSDSNFFCADLNEASFADANLSWANLSEANLVNVSFWDANLTNADLSCADLSDADFTNANLTDADLSFSKLGGADLSRVNLTNANLSHADLSRTSLHAAQVLGCNLSQAILTGACIQDWQFGQSTRIDGVKCDYVFRYFKARDVYTHRLPSNLSHFFSEGEFEAWVKTRASALNTIDLTFTEGIDWPVFFQSFQELCNQTREQNLSIQGIERKGMVFVIRLETEQGADRGSIEAQFKKLYGEKLEALEAQYEERLRLQGLHLEDLRQTLKFDRQRMTSIVKIAEVMADKQGNTFNTHVTGIVGAIGGDNHGAMTYNGTNAEEVVRLIQNLRQQLQSFPVPQQNEATDCLNDLEEYIQQPPEKRKPNRIKATLVALLAISLGIGGAIATATDFANNVLELSDKLGIEIALPKATQQTSPIHTEVIELSSDGGDAP